MIDLIRTDRLSKHIWLVQLRPCGRGAGDQYGPSPTDSTDACNINGVDDRTIGDTVLKWNKV